MIYKSFETESQGKIKIFYTSTPLEGVVSINKITFNTTPRHHYKIYAEFNDGGFIEVDENILYNLASLLESSIDVNLKFSFETKDNIENVCIDYTTTEEFILGLVSDEEIENISNKIYTNYSNEIHSNISLDSSISPLNLNNSISFWKGNLSAFNSISSKLSDRVYFVLDTKQIYLGTNLINSVAWGTTTGSQSVALTVDGISNTLSLSTHTHSNYVPTSRTINGKQLNANITLTAANVGALGASETAVDSNKLNGKLASSYLGNEAATSSTSGAINANNIASNSFKHDSSWSNSASNSATSSIIDISNSSSHRTQLHLIPTSGLPSMYIRSAFNSTWSNWYTVYHSGNVNNTNTAWSASNLTLKGSLSGVTTGSFSGVVTLSNTTETTSATTGALKVSGGVGISKKLHVGGDITTNGEVSLGGNVNLVYNATNKTLQFIFK